MKNSKIRWLVLIVLLVGITVGYYFWTQTPQQRPQVEPAPVAAGPVTEAPAGPTIRHPLPEAELQPEEAAEPLPALGESDGAVTDALRGVVGEKWLKELFQQTDVVRRIVATVDNLPRERVGQSLLPVKPPGGLVITSGKDETPVFSKRNFARYTPYVRLAEAVDADKLVAAYVRFYPLFQEEYEDLGYPGKYFNDRLVDVIDHLLAAPEVTGPVKLVQPRVLYQFADPDLEARSAGQKILIRMGSENSLRVKAKLREIRQALAREGPKP